MKIGLFGGSFDPVHYGHIRPVQEARRQLGLDRVLYLPTARPPHKSQRRFAPAYARFCMVEMALLAEEGLYVSTHELTLGRPAYTVETLEHFQRTGSGAQLYLLIGADSFVDLNRWHRWRDIPSAARLAVLERPGWDLRGPGLPPELADLAESDRVHFVPNLPVEVSSTDLRALFARGEDPPPSTVPPMVVDYIRKYALYDEDPSSQQDPTLQPE